MNIVFKILYVAKWRAGHLNLFSIGDFPFYTPSQELTNRTLRAHKHKLWYLNPGVTVAVKNMWPTTNFPLSLALCFQWLTLKREMYFLAKKNGKKRKCHHQFPTIYTNGMITKTLMATTIGYFCGLFKASIFFGKFYYQTCAQSVSGHNSPRKIPLHFVPHENPIGNKLKIQVFYSFIFFVIKKCVCYC